MKANTLIAIVVVLFLSVDAYAQGQPKAYQGKSHRSPEEWAIRRTEKKLKIKDMPRSERKAFKNAHRQQRQSRLNAMTPEQRSRVLERRRLHKESR